MNVRRVSSSGSKGQAGGLREGFGWMVIGLQPECTRYSSLDLVSIVLCIFSGRSAVPATQAGTRASMICLLGAFKPSWWKACEGLPSDSFRKGQGDGVVGMGEGARVNKLDPLRRTCG